MLSVTFKCAKHSQRIIAETLAQIKCEWVLNLKMLQVLSISCILTKKKTLCIIVVWHQLPLIIRPDLRKNGTILHFQIKLRDKSVFISLIINQIRKDCYFPKNMKSIFLKFLVICWHLINSTWLQKKKVVLTVVKVKASKGHQNTSKFSEGCVQASFSHLFCFANCGH